MPDDIPSRLRAMAGPIVPNVCTEAADEIERLREQLRLANIDNFNTTAALDRLRDDRDEARREAVYQWLRGEAVAEGNYGGGKTADALYDRLRSEFPDRDAMYAVEPKWKANQ